MKTNIENTLFKYRQLLKEKEFNCALLSKEIDFCRKVITDLELVEEKIINIKE